MRLLHLILNDTTVDVVEDRLDDGRVAIGAIVAPKISQVLIESTENRIPVIVVEYKTV